MVEREARLTPRQERIWTFVARYYLEHGYPPTIREIREELGISSTSVVSYNLEVLERQGYLRRNRYSARSLEILRWPPEAGPVPLEGLRRVEVPLLGRIAAGLPIPTPPDDPRGLAETVEVPAALLPPGEDAVYALRVEGDSMIDALIADGDLVLLRYQERADPGQTVAAEVYSEETGLWEVTLKQLVYDPARPDPVTLRPANPAYAPLVLPADRVRIRGVLVGLLRRYG